MGVAIMSFLDGYSLSINISHMALPPNANNSDCQKLNPLARPALKYNEP